MRWKMVVSSVLALLFVGCGDAPPPAPQAPTPGVATATAGAPSGGSAPVPDAHPLTAEQAVTRLFTTPKASEVWFSPAFLAAIPIERVGPILDDMRRVLGAFQHVDKDGASYRVAFERGSVPTDVKLDDAGRFTMLFFHVPEMKKVGLDQAVNGFKAFPGQVHVLVVSDGVERASLNPDMALGVGSAFKLAILAALREEVTAKKHAWADVVELRPAWKSLPSGFLQSWPDKTPLTLGTLASVMISQSDNTAADALLDVAGRTAVEKYAGRNRPFLSTREAFILKDPANLPLLERYRKGDENARRALLIELAGKPLPPVESFTDEPRALDVEWTFSAREMCDLMKKVSDLPLMAINAGVALPTEWERVAYKGGSEPGVLNFTSEVEKGGKHHCVVATWNAKERLDEMRFVTTYRQVLSSLK